MKPLIMGLFILLASSGLIAQSSFQNLEDLIHQFNEGGATNDISKIKPILHENFRVVFNNIAEKKVQILDRETYLGLVEKKVFGGEERKVLIENIQLEEGLMASAKTQQQGSKNTIYALKNFVYQNGQWLMTEEIVYMK